jgi:hypothetical protein
VASKDFNIEEEEPPIGEKDQIFVLSFEAGDLIIITKEANAHGWLEGYVHNDPECLAGVTHTNFCKLLRFE